MIRILPEIETFFAQSTHGILFLHESTIAQFATCWKFRLVRPSNVSPESPCYQQLSCAED